MTERQLNAAKRQFIGQIGISRDAHEGYAVALGRAYSRYASHRDLDELAKTINELTAEELHQAALDTFRPEHLMLLVYAPEDTRLEV
jgi:predicted Zn-dependent peptidase